MAVGLGALAVARSLGDLPVAHPHEVHAAEWLVAMDAPAENGAIAVHVHVLDIERVPNKAPPPIADKAFPPAHPPGKERSIERPVGGALLRGGEALKPRRYVEGLLAGVGATVPMTVAMDLARRSGFVRRLPPEEITDRMLASTDATDATPGERETVAAMVHLATGAALGAVYAALPKPKRLAARLGVGAAYGVAVYTANYFGIAPALRLMPAPSEDRPQRQTTTLVAHVIFGVALALFLRPDDAT